MYMRLSSSTTGIYSAIIQCIFFFIHLLFLWGGGLPFLKINIPAYCFFFFFFFLKGFIFFFSGWSQEDWKCEFVLLVFSSVLDI